VNEAVDALRRASRVALVSHRDPDGDTVGSVLALGLALEAAGKTVSFHCADPIPEDLRFLSGSERYQRTRPPFPDADVVVTVDLGERSRAGLELPPEASQDGAGSRLLNVDHHKSNSMFGDINFVDPTSAASGEMVARIVDALGVTWTPDMATAALTALMTDTGSFQFPNTDPRVLELAARLRAAGADISSITYNVFRNRRFEATRLWGAAFTRIERDPDGVLVWTWIDRADLDRAGAREEHVAGLVEQVARTTDNRVAFLFNGVKPGEVRISCRTSPFEPCVDAAVLMGKFGGGGHARAAGAVVPGALESVKARVLDEARGAIRAARAAIGLLKV
jgi:phosphoesterase RecJ-like protein